MCLQVTAAAPPLLNATVDERIGKQMTSLLPALTEAVQGIVQARQAWLAHSETAMLKFATAIAARIPLTRSETAARHHADAHSRSSWRWRPGARRFKSGPHLSRRGSAGRTGPRPSWHICGGPRSEVIADETISGRWVPRRHTLRSPRSHQQLRAELARIEEELNRSALRLKDAFRPPLAETPLCWTSATQLDQMLPTALWGSVVRTVGMTAAVADFPAPIGAVVEIQRQSGKPLAGEVIGFCDDLTIVYLLDEINGIRRGNRVRVGAHVAMAASGRGAAGPCGHRQCSNDRRQAAADAPRPHCLRAAAPVGHPSPPH